MGFFDKLKKIWQEDIIGYSISEADEAFFEDLEEMLILADVGMETSTRAVEQLRSRMKREGISGQEAVKDALRDILAEMLNGRRRICNIDWPIREWKKCCYAHDCRS